MRAVLQRVTRAAVRAAGTTVGAFDEPGLVVLLGVSRDDGKAQVAWMASKVAGLRVLHEERSLLEAGAPALVVSQFTLYGDARKGRRPTWQAAAPGEIAEPLYESFCEALAELGVRVERGRFGADMQVELVGDGPMTVWLESPRD